MPFLIGVITHPKPDLKAPYFVETLRGLKQVFRFLVINPRPGENLSGLILLAPQRGDPWVIRAKRNRIPTVVVNALLPGFPSIDVDNVEAARLIVSHLLRSHARRIALINGKLSTPNGVDRQRGYRRGLAEARVPFRPSLVAEGRFSREGGRKAMKRLLQADPPPDAIFAANDHMALGAWDVLRSAGSRVPEEFLIGGFDDIPEAARAGLTTVRQPLAAMARQAGEWLLKWLRSGQNPGKTAVIVNGKLVVRSSTVV